MLHMRPVKDCSSSGAAVGGHAALKPARLSSQLRVCLGRRTQAPKMEERTPAHYSVLPGCSPRQWDERFVARAEPSPPWETVSPPSPPPSPPPLPHFDPMAGVNTFFLDIGLVVLIFDM